MIKILPDMGICSWCKELELGYWRINDGFVCSLCWTNHMEKVFDIEEIEEDEVPSLVFPER